MVKRAAVRIFRAAEGRVLPDADGDAGMEMLPMAQSTQAGFERLVAAGMGDGSVVKDLFEAPGFFLSYNWFKPHFPLPRHSHRQECLYYIVSGGIRLGTERLGAGDGFFLPDGTPYTFTVGDEGVEMLEFRHTSDIDFKTFGHSRRWWEKAEKAIRDNRTGWRAMVPPRAALRLDDIGGRQQDNRSAPSAGSAVVAAGGVP